MAYEDVILADGATWAYALDEASGNLTDFVHGLTATVSGTPTYGVTGPVVGHTAVDFSASSQYFTASDNDYFDLGANNFSLEAWYARDTDSGGWETWFSKGANAYFIGLNSDDHPVLGKSGYGAIAITDATVTADGNWHHYVWTRANGASVAGDTKLYIDGELQTLTTEDYANALSDNTNGLCIGRDLVDGDPASGKVGYIAGYKGTVLSSTQVTDHYDARLAESTDASAGLASGTGQAWGLVTAGNVYFYAGLGGGAAGAAPSLVQVIGAQTFSADANATTLTSTATVTAGNVIYVAAAWHEGGTPTCADNLGNTYTLRGSSQNFLTTALFSAPVTSGGSLTSITVTQGAWSVGRSIAAVEMAHVSTYDSSGGDNKATSGTATWANAVTIPANGLAIGAVGTYEARTQTIGAASGSPSTSAAIIASAAGPPGLVIARAVAGASAVSSYSGTTTFTSNEWAAPGTVFDGESTSGGSTGTAHNASVTISGSPTATLQQLINAASPGSTLDVSGRTFSAGATVSKPLTILGGTINCASGTGGLIITSSSVTVDGMTIRGYQRNTYREAETGIFAYGSSSTNRISTVTIRNCTVTTFGNSGIYLQYVDNFTVYHNTVEEVIWGGIYCRVVANGVINWNVVRRVDYYTGAAGDNAYGITVLCFGEATIYSRDVIVADNLVEDVPWWEGIDTHNGLRISFLRNIVRRCSVNLELTISDSGGHAPTDIVVTGNWFSEPTTYRAQGGHPVVLYKVAGATFTDNRIIGFGSESPTDAAPWFDFTGMSTGLSATGNRVVSGKGAATAAHPWVSSSSLLTGPIAATGTANNATVSKTSGGTNAQAQAAAASGSATAAPASIGWRVGTAAATGAASGPTPRLGARNGTAPTGTGAANNATTTAAITPGLGVATATGTVGQGVANPGAKAQSTAAATGAGQGVDASLGAWAGVGEGSGAAYAAAWSASIPSTATTLAAGTGEAQAPGPNVGATGIATATGAAADATATTVSGVYGAAECATGTASAGASASVGTGSIATGTAEAQTPSVLTTGAVSAGAAAGTGTAASPVANIVVYAGSASAVGSALPVVFSLRPAGGIATASGDALAGSTALGPTSVAGAGTGTAHGVTWSSTSTGQASAGFAAATAIAWTVKRNAAGGKGPRGRGHHHVPRGDAATVS